MLLFSLCLSTPAAAQDDLQSWVTRSILNGGKRDGFLTLNVENDKFGGGTDRNYTSGIRLTYYDFGAIMPKFMKAVDKAVPTFTINTTTSIYYSLGQNIYTPRDVTLAAQDPDDRPWGGFLYASAGLSNATRNHFDNIEATLGVVGPAALGEQTQKFVHKHISGSPEPQGWDNQLKNEPAVMLSWERSWPSRYGAGALGWNLYATPHMGVTVGNVYTHANTGFSVSLSPHADGWQDAPVRVRPAMPGTGAFTVPDRAFSWYLFGGVDTRAVARNIFLDGNTFTDSHSVDKKYFVADASAGLAVTHGMARLSYALNYRTREFDTQDEGDVFGTVSLGLRF